MDNEKNNDRYFTNQEEFQILKDNLVTYFTFPNRSQDSKTFITQIQQKLEKN